MRKLISAKLLVFGFLVASVISVGVLAAEGLPYSPLANFGIFDDPYGPYGPPIVCGDQDGDGRVTILDAIIDMQFIVGIAEPTPGQFALSDLDGDGIISVVDAIILLQFLVGRIDHLDCGAAPPIQDGHSDSAASSLFLEGVGI